MIAYTRTIDFVADLFEELIDVPMQIIDSEKSTSVLHVFTDEEAKEYDLKLWEQFQTQRIPDTTKLIVIRSKDLEHVKEKIDGLVEGVEWQTLNPSGSLGNEYVYKSRSGEIRFKIGKLRKERTLIAEPKTHKR